MAFELTNFGDAVGNTIFRQQAGGVSALEAWGDKFFVGTNGGYLIQYRIEPPADPGSLNVSNADPLSDSGPKERRGKLVIGKKLELQPVHAIKHLYTMNMLVVLCGEKLTLHKAKDLQLIATVPSYKKIDTFCCSELDPIHYLCVTIEKTLYLYKYETNYILHDKFALPEAPLGIEWAGRFKDSNYVYIAFKSEYVALELKTGCVRQLLSFSLNAKTCMKLLGSDELVYCFKQMGYFCDVSGFLNRLPIAFKSTPVSIAESFPYIAALTASGSVEVHSVYNPKGTKSFTFSTPARCIASNGNIIIVATNDTFHILVPTSLKHRYGDHDMFMQIFQHPSKKLALKEYINKVLNSNATPFGMLISNRVNRFKSIYGSSNVHQRTIDEAKEDIESSIRYLQGSLTSYLKEFLPRKEISRSMKAVSTVYHQKIYTNLIAFIQIKNKRDDLSFYQRILKLQELPPTQLGIREKFWIAGKKKHPDTMKLKDLVAKISAPGIMYHYDERASGFSNRSEVISLILDKKTNQICLLIPKTNETKVIDQDDIYRNKRNLAFIWAKERIFAKIEIEDITSYTNFFRELKPDSSSVIFDTATSPPHPLSSITTSDKATKVQITSTTNHLPTVKPQISRPISLPDGLSSLEGTSTVFLKPEEENEEKEEDSEGGRPYEKAIMILKRVSELQTAKQKLRCIHSSLQMCIKCVQEFWKTKKSDKGLLVGADDLVPIFSYVVLQSDLKNVMSEISFLLNFSEDRLLRGKEGYSLATFQTAVGFLANFDQINLLETSSSSSSSSLAKDIQPVDECEKDTLHFQRLLNEQFHEEFEGFGLTEPQPIPLTSSTNTSTSSSLTTSPSSSPQLTRFGFASPSILLSHLPWNNVTSTSQWGASLPPHVHQSVAKFGLPPEEVCQSYYPCSLNLHRGHIYITQNYLIFESMQRRLAMNLADISSIKKERFAFVLDNAIKIVLQDGQYFNFTSIPQRDDAFNNMLIQMQKNCGLIPALDYTQRCVTFTASDKIAKIGA